jgi:hypothetical protein
MSPSMLSTHIIDREDHRDFEPGLDSFCWVHYVDKSYLPLLLPRLPWLPPTDPVVVSPSLWSLDPTVPGHAKSESPEVPSRHAQKPS